MSLPQKQAIDLGCATVELNLHAKDFAPGTCVGALNGGMFCRHLVSVLGPASRCSETFRDTQEAHKNQKEDKVLYIE